MEVQSSQTQVQFSQTLLQSSQIQIKLQVEVRRLKGGSCELHLSRTTEPEASLQDQEFLVILAFL